MHNIVLFFGPKLPDSPNEMPLSPTPFPHGRVTERRTKHLLSPHAFRWPRPIILLRFDHRVFVHRFPLPQESGPTLGTLTHRSHCLPRCATLTSTPPFFQRCGPAPCFIVDPGPGEHMLIPEAAIPSPLNLRLFPKDSVQAYACSAPVCILPCFKTGSIPNTRVSSNHF
jgi:hypothetical protein